MRAIKRQIEEAGLVWEAIENFDPGHWLAEMKDGDVYDAVDRYSKQGRIAYVHLRNVKGKVPHYKETHIDERDLDVLRVMRILESNGYGGVVIPDHAPQLTCDAPLHAGMAFAMGYLRACLKVVETETEERKGSTGCL